MRSKIFGINAGLLWGILFTAMSMVGCGGGGSSDGDLTPPSLTVDAISPQTFESAKILKGTVEPGAEIEIEVSTDAKVGEVSIVDGVWTAEISELEPGLNTVSVQAEDSDGNDLTLLFNLTYDVVRLDLVPQGVAGDTVEIRGTLVAGGSIDTVSLNNDEIESPALTFNGNAWTLTVGGLNSGKTNTIEISASDGAAVPQKQDVTVSVVQNNNILAVTINPPALPLTENTVTLEGTVVEGGELDNVTVLPSATVGDTTYPDPPGSWEVTIADLAEGQSIVTVPSAALSDSDGKIVSSAWVRLIVETDPEVVSGGLFPAPDAVDAKPEDVVTVEFSEAVVGTTLTGDSFFVESGGEKVAGVVAFKVESPEDGKVKELAVFTPEEPFVSGVTYSATITDAVLDPQGNSLTNPQTWSFTVE